MTDSPRKEGLQRLVTEPGRELGRLSRLVTFQVGLWRYCTRRLRENNVMAMSAALSFRTIFALIPTLVLAFLAARAVGALEDSKQSLRRILHASGMDQIAALPDDEAGGPAAVAASAPAAGLQVINVADKIEEIVASVESKLTFERVGPVGGALFIWTAITLLTTIERSLNRVFAAPRSRALPRRVMLYWSVMTLGPLVLAVASHFGRRAIETVQGMRGLAWAVVGVGWLGPILVGVIVLAAVYLLVPNTSVDPRAALGGALIAAVLWLTAKWGFSQYVQKLVVRGNLYGVLGVLPLFMMWLNLSWLIFLFGAELTHAAAHVGRTPREAAEGPVFLSEMDALAAALAVAAPFEAGQGPVSLRALAVDLGLADEAAAWLAERLTATGILVRASAGPQEGYALARPARGIALADVLAAVDRPREPKAVSRHASSAIESIRTRMIGPLAELSLADVLADPPSRKGLRVHTP